VNAERCDDEGLNLGSAGDIKLESDLTIGVRECTTVGERDFDGRT